MREAIAQLVEGWDLGDAQMEAAMGSMLRGEASAAQIAGLLVALRIKGETAEELAAAARVMRVHAVPVKVSGDAPILDTCGTGGSGTGAFNISTLSAIVVAACGVRVAKHGNRAASSKCGSADLLEALGVDLAMSPQRIAHCIEREGIGFMFARAHHPAMKHVAPVRGELGIRTLFNFLGPVSNPAGATHQLLGIGDQRKQRLMAEVLQRLGSRAAWVVHGDGGIDEIALSGPTAVVTLRDGEIGHLELRPADFGVAEAPLQAIVGGDAAENAAMARAILDGQPGPPRDAVVVNAAAALCVVGAARDVAEGAERARAALDDGSARAKLAAWVALSVG